MPLPIGAHRHNSRHLSMFECLPEDVIHNVLARLNDEDLTSLTLTSKSIAARPALNDEWAERLHLTGFSFEYSPNRAHILPRQVQKATQFGCHYEKLKLRAASLDVQADSQTIKQYITTRSPAYESILVHTELVFPRKRPVCQSLVVECAHPGECAMDSRACAEHARRIFGGWRRYQ